MIVPWIDLAFAAYTAGFRGEAHAIAVALAQPESGRNTDAVNSTDPNGGSFGLLQINGVHDPNATGTYPDKVPTAAWKELMKDPLENYKVAFKVWNSASKSFNPWGAFTSGAHVPYLPEARIALDARARLARLETINLNHTAARAALQAELTALNASLALVKGELDAEKAAHTTTKQTLALVEGELTTTREELNSAIERATALDARLANKNILLDQARAV
jgi:hypothetical protein